ncbi:MAG: LutC/YkgG family protein [Rhodococcus sp. (in: high G+C Gram-positive bacteria)]
MSAKSDILDRIAEATREAPAAPPVPRHYEHAPATGPGNVARFAETVDDYRAQVFRITEHDLAAKIADLLPANATVVVPSDLPESWTAGVTTIRDHGMSVEQLDSVDAVVTGCRVGIAATGTIVLDAGVGQGRRVLTLVPDHHICVVRADQVVDTVPQAFASLDATLPLTFISGPSATSDIELNRVEGVHGPRTLDVIIVENVR